MLESKGSNHQAARRRIDVEPHDPAWHASFTLEADALGCLFGDSLVAVHHVGSTSVPGLPAKPVIDILVVLHETGTIDRFSGAMEVLGYRVRGECLDAEVPGTKGRFYFSKPAAGTRTHHLHACAVGHDEIVNMLAFRDYLRAHPARAAEYGALKQDLAVRHRHDNIGYMRAKDAFIKSVLEEARGWSRSRSLE